MTQSEFNNLSSIEKVMVIFQNRGPAMQQAKYNRDFNKLPKNYRTESTAEMWQDLSMHGIDQYMYTIEKIAIAEGITIDEALEMK